MNHFITKATNYDKIVEFMSDFNYCSLRLILFLISKEAEKEVKFTQYQIMRQTGLCLRSLQYGIKELESFGLLTRGRMTYKIDLSHLTHEE